MKNNLRFLCVFALSLTLVSCSSSTEEVKEAKFVNNVTNGGFESTDLSGWTIEYGDAYNDDSVSSKKDFYF